MWASWGPASSSAPDPVPVPVPDPIPIPIPIVDDPVADPVPVPVPVIGSEDDGDLSSVSSDHPVPSYPSLTFEDVPRRPRTKHTKRLAQPTVFPFSSPKVPVLPKSKSVSFRK